MPRIRSTHPRQWTDGEFVSCSPLARLLALAVRNEADDNGIFEVKPVELKIRYLPVDNCDIEELIAELEGHQQIRCWLDGERRYALIRSFQKYQKPKAPSFLHPCPPASVLNPKEGFATHSDFPIPSDHFGNDSEEIGNPAETGVQRGEEEGSGGDKRGEEEDTSQSAEADPNPSPKRIPVDWVVEEYNSMARDTGLPEVTTLTDRRRRSIRARLREHGEIAVREVLNAPRNSAFLRGEAGRETWTGATLDWLMRPKYFVPTLEGQYKDKQRRTNPTATHTTNDPADAEWMYDTYRRADLERNDGNPLWPTYCTEAAGCEPRTAPTFADWLAERERGEAA